MNYTNMKFIIFASFCQLILHILYTIILKELIKSALIMGFDISFAPIFFKYEAFIILSFFICAEYEWVSLISGGNGQTSVV